MKQYLLFAGPDYYPAGGWNDYHGDFDSIEEAEEKGRVTATYNESEGNEVTVALHDWWHVVDTTTGLIVSQSESKPL